MCFLLGICTMDKKPEKTAESREPCSREPDVSVVPEGEEEDPDLVLDSPIDQYLRKPNRSRFAVNGKLVPLKILMLLMYGGMASLFPYLTVHMKTLGLTLMECSIVYGLLPFFSCLGPLLGGYLADKIGNYKAVLISFNVFNIIVHMLMGFAVPSALPSVATVGFQHATFNATLNCSSIDIIHLYDIEVVDQECKPNSILLAPLSKSEMRLDACEAEVQCYPSNWSVCDNCSQTTTALSFAPEDLVSPSPGQWLLGYVRLPEFAGVIDDVCREPKSEWCSVTCRALTNITGTCRATFPPSNHLVTFIVYLVLRLLSGMGGATLFPLMDAAAYTMSEEHDGDLGFQRMFSLIGVAAFPPLSGYLVGLMSEHYGSPNYSPSFYMFLVMHISALVISCFMKLSLRSASQNIMYNVGKMMRNPKVFVFVLMMLLSGCAWGFLENYLFWFMEGDLSSPTWVLGMTNTVSSIAALPVVACSMTIIKYLGHTKIFIMCFLLYGVRFLCYSYTYNPFLILPVEALEALTTSLLWVVASVYCGKIAPDYLATLQGIVGSVHYAMGRGIGGMIGGVMFATLKPRTTYFLWGCACMVIGIIYAILHYAWLRTIPNPQKGGTAAAGKGGRPRPSLSPEDEKELERFAKMEAFSRRYTMPNVLVTEATPLRRGSQAPFRKTDPYGARRRSTLVPALANIGVPRN